MGNHFCSVCIIAFNSSGFQKEQNIIISSIHANFTFSYMEHSRTINFTVKLYKEQEKDVRHFSFWEMCNRKNSQEALEIKLARRIPNRQSDKTQKKNKNTLRAPPIGYRAILVIALVEQSQIVRHYLRRRALYI